MCKQFNVNGETYDVTPDGIEALLAERLTGTDTDGEITIAGVDNGDKAASLLEALLNCAVKLYAMEELVEQGELVLASKEGGDGARDGE